MKHITKTVTKDLLVQSSIHTFLFMRGYMWNKIILK